jgi:hypothetical protein
MTDEAILALARERFQTIVTAESDIREAALEDIKFAYNVDEGQWRAEDRSAREKDGRPCLTANKLRKFLAIVTNQERENRIAGKVRPVDDQGDAKTAAVYEDLIRHIEYQSDAEYAYAKGGERAAAGGYGYWRILTEYCDDSFDQELRIAAVENAFSVYLDPRRMYGFVTEVLPESEFAAQYPNAQAVDFDGQARGEGWTLWYEPKKVRVAEYFYKERTEKTIAQVRAADGAVSVVELTGSVTRATLAADGFTVLRTRVAVTDAVRWCKITGHEILERRDWPGRAIPLIEVLGDDVNVDGKVYKRSLIRDGKDPQRQYNYWVTAATELVALAPKSPYIVSQQQISGLEKIWDEANIKNLPYLPYHPSGGQPPRREPPPQMSTAYQQMLQLSSNDVKDTLGMYESFLGEPSNERSGRAIFARERRGQIGTFHFPDNLRRAVLETVRQLIDLIPRVYDTERVVRLRNERGEERTERINHTLRDATGQPVILPETGQPATLHDLSVGKYDVVADVRRYSTRRQETVELLTESMQYAPAVAPALVPLLFKYVDSEAAGEIEAAVTPMLGTPPAGGAPPTLRTLPA